MLVWLTFLVCLLEVAEDVVRDDKDEAERAEVMLETREPVDGPMVEVEDTVRLAEEITLCLDLGRESCSEGTLSWEELVGIFSAGNRTREPVGIVLGFRGPSLLSLLGEDTFAGLALAVVRLGEAKEVGVFAFDTLGESAFVVETFDFEGALNADRVSSCTDVVVSLVASQRILHHHHSPDI